MAGCAAPRWYPDAPENHLPLRLQRHVSDQLRCSKQPRLLRRALPILPPTALTATAHLQPLAQPTALRHPGFRCDIDSHPDCRATLNGQSIARRLAAAAKAAGIEGRITGCSGRAGLASELTARDASTTETMLAGGWKTARMVAHYSAAATAELGAVAKYL